MADSDDEYDRKRRDKFRGERSAGDNYRSERRGDDRRSGGGRGDDWGDRNPFRGGRGRPDYRDYRGGGGGGGGGGGRDRYSPGRDLPPPKRMRPDWGDDARPRYGGNDQSKIKPPQEQNNATAVQSKPLPTHKHAPAQSQPIRFPIPFISNPKIFKPFMCHEGYPMYGWGHEPYPMHAVHGGGFGGGHPPMNNHGRNEGSTNTGDLQTQPPMLTLKQFLDTQDDTISDSEVLRKYSEYKLDFKRQQLNEFFVAHKDEEWFKSKYHPEESLKRKEEQMGFLKHRVDVFTELLDDGTITSVTVDTNQTDPLLRILDTVVIKLEGGTEEDLKILDEKPPVQEYQSSFQSKFDTKRTDKDDDDVIITAVQPIAKRLDDFNEDDWAPVQKPSVSKKKNDDDDDNWDCVDTSESITKKKANVSGDGDDWDDEPKKSKGHDWDDEPKKSKGGDDWDDEPKKSKGGDDWDDEPKKSKGGDDWDDEPKKSKGGDDWDDEPKKSKGGDDWDDAPKKSKGDDWDDAPKKSKGGDDWDDAPKKSKSKDVDDWDSFEAPSHSAPKKKDDWDADEEVEPPKKTSRKRSRSESSSSSSSSNRSDSRDRNAVEKADEVTETDKQSEKPASPGNDVDMKELESTKETEKPKEAEAADEQSNAIEEQNGSPKPTSPITIKVEAESEVIAIAEEVAVIDDDKKPTEVKEAEDDAKTETIDLDKEKDPEPEKPKPRALHRTSSIFLRNLAPTITKSEIEAVCKRYDGYLRVAIADPLVERRWFRRGWVTFKRDVNIKEICWNLNNIRLRDCEMGAIVNRDLSRRVRPVNGITAHKTIVRSDIKLCAKIAMNLDEKFNLWLEERIKEATAAAATNGSQKPAPSQSFGFKSNNPVLQNITDFLIEEASAEEDELLGLTGSENKDLADGESLERDLQLIAVLDKLILYLRIVHSVDFYNHCEYPYEDEMPNRCGIIHARGPPPQNKITNNDIQDYIKNFETKMQSFLVKATQIEQDELKNLGIKDPEAEVEKFIQANTQELAKDKWLCPLSGKKFKGPEFIRKHIFNKHGEKVDEVRKEVEYFNNYLKDAKRPQLPEHPGSTRRQPVEPMGQPMPYRAGYPAPGYGPPYAAYAPPMMAAPRPRGFGGPGRRDLPMDHQRRLVGYHDLDAPQNFDMFE